MIYLPIIVFLPSLDLIRDHNIKENIDLFIALDSSDMDRLGIGKQFALKADKIINIDHHITMIILEISILYLLHLVLQER